MQPLAKELTAFGQTRCLKSLPGSRQLRGIRSHKHVWERHRRGEGGSGGGNGDCGDFGDDDGGDGPVDGQGVACASRAQTRVSSAYVGARMAPGATDVHAWAGEGGRTSALVAVLAAQKDPLSPAAGLGPIHGMSRAARSKAHALSG